MIVVDLGCHDDEWSSLHALVERFTPERVYGFDPRAEDADYEIDGVPVTVRGMAAWLHDGTVNLFADGTSTRVAKGGDFEAPCFDFCRWLASACASTKAIVKMDIEGAEYPLLAAMHDGGYLAYVDTLVVEFHDVHVMPWWN